MDYKDAKGLCCVVRLVSCDSAIYHYSLILNSILVKDLLVLGFYQLHCQSCIYIRTREVQTQHTKQDNLVVPAVTCTMMTFNH